MKILGPWRRPRHRTVLPGSNLSEAAIGVTIRSCPGVQPRRSYSRLHATIADSASFANSADRFANNFASDSLFQTELIRLQRSEFMQSSIDALKAPVQHGAEQIPGPFRLTRACLG